MIDLAHANRAQQALRVLVRHLDADVARAAAVEPALQPEPSEMDGDPVRLARDLEDLGPTFVKLGQTLATRADLLPPVYLEALGRLHDDVAPVPVETVRATIERELGHDVDDLFAWFDDTPLAAASLCQVHRARLANGREVVVKVQRPDVSSVVRTDIDLLESAAHILDDFTDIGRRFAFTDMIDSFRQSLVAELDLRNEAANLDAFAGVLAEYDRLAVPRPVHELTAARVLTMDFVPGGRVTDLGPLAITDLDGSEIAGQLIRAYLDQILVHGVVHADPHPGNLLLHEGTLTLIDLGMVTRLPHRVRTLLLELMLALADGRADEVVRASIELGTPLDDFDRRALERHAVRLVGEFQSAAVGRLDAGAVMLALTQACSASGLRPPAELTMVGKALLHLDGVISILAPTMQADEVLRDHASSLIRDEIESGVSPMRAAQAAISAARLAEHLPDHVHSIVRDLAAGELEVRVNAFDQDELLRGLEKIATRLTVGIVLAGMVVGAALAMRVESDVQLLGVPAVAMVFFVLAAGAGLHLSVQVLLGDRRDRRRRRNK